MSGPLHQKDPLKNVIFSQIELLKPFFFLFPSINQILSELFNIPLNGIDEIPNFSYSFAFCNSFSPFYRKKCVMFMCHKMGNLYYFLKIRKVFY